ncbi:MAG: ADP-glyceromanno-heptose 6-epimerase [Bacteroidales bacterium]
MIVITGAAGFIGSALAHYLNEQFYNDLVLVDDFSRTDKGRNLKGLQYTALVPRDEFDHWLDGNHRLVQFVFHLGARTDTAEFNRVVFERLNLNYSKMVWARCVQYGLPLVYASSAATYGLGEHGYRDDHAIVPFLKPLNPYGESKNEFDKWVLEQKQTPYFWAGFKFFNVYGPNEYHKGRMASVVFHAYKQIKETGKMKLFRSHREDFKDGEQKRDFVYVRDVVRVLFYFMHHRKDSGIYNLGTGKARTFLDLARNVFRAMGKEEIIEFIDTPADIRDKYQYFTEADISKLRKAGYTDDFSSLEEGISEYVARYLIPDKCFGE